MSDNNKETDIIEEQTADTEPDRSIEIPDESVPESKDLPELESVAAEEQEQTDSEENPDENDLDKEETADTDDENGSETDREAESADENDLIAMSDIELAAEEWTDEEASADSDSTAEKSWEIPKEQLTQIVEGLIFVNGRVLGKGALVRAIPQAQASEIREVLSDLLHKWADPSLGFHLVEISNGYQFRSDPLCAPYIQEMLRTKPLKLSRPALESLAIVAYRQPITRAEIEDIRGVDSGGVLRLLLDKKLIRILGKREEPGRPLIYGTSKDFLETFHLRSLRDLPTLQEFQELTEEHQIKVESTYGREESGEEPVQGMEEEEDPIYRLAGIQADDSEAAAELAKAADALDEAVETVDQRMREVLGRVPYDEQDEQEPGQAVAEVEVIANPEGSLSAQDDGKEEPESVSSEQETSKSSQEDEEEQ